MKEGKVLDLLKAADSEDIVYRLTYYALERARCYSWVGGTTSCLPMGKAPEDIACEAIEKVLSGIRKWDPDKYPNLLTHLKWIVKSDMGHLFSSKEHKSSSGMNELGVDQVDTNPAGASLETRVKTPEEELIHKEEEIFDEKLKSVLYNLAKGDEDLEIVLLCIEEGMDKPAAIAKEMGWDVNKVNNLKKRLRRLGDKAVKDVELT